MWREFYNNEKNRLFGEGKMYKVYLYLGVLVLECIAYYVKKNGSNVIVIAMLLIGLSLVIFYHLLLRRAIKNRVRGYENSKPYTITVSDVGVTYLTESSNAEFKWDFFKNYKEFEGNFTLYYEERESISIYLPLSLAPDSGNLSEIVRQNVKLKEI